MTIADKGSWYNGLGQQLEVSGFSEVVSEKCPLKAHQSKAWTEDYLLAWRDVGEMLPSEKDAPGSPMTKEAYNNLFGAVVEEARKGMTLHSGYLLTVIGKK